MKKLIKYGLLFLCVMALVIVALLWKIKDDMTPVVVVVGENIELSEKWTYITPSPGLKPEKYTQSIAIKKGANDVAGPNIFRQMGKIPLVDGKNAEVDVEVFDDHGKKYELTFDWESGYHIAFGPAYPEEFPKDRMITKIAIKSNIPFSCTIVWYCNSPK